MKKHISKTTELFSSMLNHITPFELRLTVFLSEKCKASNITYGDIKDIIWNEHESALTSRIAFQISEDNPKTKIEDILEIISEAWNNFPHKSLNGLAPRDMVERIKINKDFVSENRPDFYTIFEDKFPKETHIAQQGKNEWSFEYPASFNTERAEFLAICKKDSNINNAKFEADNLMQEFSYEMSLMTAKALLDNNPFHFDAAVMLSKDAFEGNQTRTAKNILEFSVLKGREIFPPEFSFSADHLPWGFVDNRPFLRLLFKYAMLVEAIDGTQKAIPLYEELIALNPNDNQGVRDILATAYLKTNHLLDLLELDKKYPKDLMPGLSVGTILALYKLGRLDETRTRIKKSEKYFSHIFREILKITHPKPELMEDRVLVGGDDEAWFYWESQGTLWMSTRGAIEFLKKEIE